MAYLIGILLSYDQDMALADKKESQMSILFNYQDNTRFYELFIPGIF